MSYTQYCGKLRWILCNDEKWYREIDHLLYRCDSYIHGNACRPSTVYIYVRVIPKDKKYYHASKCQSDAHIITNITIQSSFSQKTLAKIAKYSEVFKMGPHEPQINHSDSCGGRPNLYQFLDPFYWHILAGDSVQLCDFGVFCYHRHAMHRDFMHAFHHHWQKLLWRESK